MKIKPLVNGTYVLQRFQAKGGWTYISIPEIIEQGKWKTKGIKIRGSIDGHDIRQLRLMRTGDMVFLPVSAVIRKAIRKKEGDKVSVVLYEDEEALLIPQLIIDCLEDEPNAMKYFSELTEGYKREYVNWIMAARHAETKASRIATMVSKLLKKQTLSKPYEQ